VEGEHSQTETLDFCSSILCFSPTSIPRRRRFASIDAATCRRAEPHGCLKRATLIAEKIDSAAGWLPENLRAEAKEMVALETMALEAIRPDAP
jgi:hypothetical protein